MVRLLPAFYSFIMFGFHSTAYCELQALDDSELSQTRAQSGLAIDIDASDLELTYSYQNNANPNEDFWIVGADPGGDLIRFNNLTVDVVGTSGGTAIAIGLPESIELDNVNTGDYYIAHPNVAPNTAAPFIDTDTSDGPNNAPTGQIPVEQQTKLIGLRWNAPIGPTTGNTLVDNFDYSQEIIRTTGQVLVFGVQ